VTGAPPPFTRRQLLLGAAAAVAGGCDVDQPRGGLLGRADRWNERVQGALFSSRRQAPEVPASALTPEEAFPRYHISPTVPTAPAGWALEVGGLVARPLRLELDDLMRMERTELRIRHHCVEGWTAVASWTGVPLSAIAARAGADPRADFVEFRSFDAGYWSSWDRGSALHPQTILAYGMNGRPLHPGHGAPLRLYSGVKLGYKMVKYLVSVRFLPRATGGYWEDRGYEWFAGV
jgi:DMSO/TMAO reductase YedYZ molybdopterin-dependent catalytic subunit